MEVVQLRDALDEGQQLGAIAGLVGLVQQQQHRAVLRQQRDHFFVRLGQPTCLDHEQDHVHVGQRLRDCAIHHAVERVAVLGLETGRVDEHELVRVTRQHAMYAVTRGLRLGRGNAHLLADQPVHQRRLADVGSTDDGDEAAMSDVGHDCP